MTQKKVKVWKDVNIQIERVVEQTIDKSLTKNKTLYYLVNAKYSDGRGIGFRADTPLGVWSELMNEVHL